MAVDPLQTVIGFGNQRVFQEMEQGTLVLGQQPPGAAQVAVGIPPLPFGS